jgi:hypothetical protein
MLTEKQLDVLEHLRSARNIAPAWKGWLTPMFCGGSDASHHSATLAGLVRKGLAERKLRGSSRSYLYRISRAGRAALLAYDGPQVVDDCWRTNDG